jgi:tetratricopeptide (TPR) repeat protein
MFSGSPKGTKKAASGTPDIRLLLGKSGRSRSGLIPAIGLGILLAAFLAAAYLVFPRQMPRPIPWLMGVAMGAMAAGTFLLGTYRSEPNAALERLRRGQHEDFGKALRVEKKPPRQVRLPIVGPVRVRMLIAAGIFVLATGWWLTPLAPVTVPPPPLEDLVPTLQDEITAPVLVAPDDGLAIVGTPAIPPGVARAAQQIGPKDNDYHRGMKALAERRFDDARRLLAAAETSRPTTQRGGKEIVPRWKVLVAEGQNEFFAGRYPEAADCFDRARKLQPDEPAIVCQAAVARLHAGQVQEAGTLAAETLKVIREKSADDELAQAAALHLQAVIATIRAEHLENAEECNAQAQSLWTDKLGGSHPAVAASQNNQGVLFLQRALYSGADLSQRDAQGNWSGSLPPEHPYRAVIAGNRAVLLLSLGRYAEASKVEKQWAESLQSIRAADRPANHRMLLVAAMVEGRLGQYDAAAGRATQALSEIQGRLGAEHLMLAAALETMVEIEVGLGRYNKAAHDALRARQVAERNLGPTHPYLARTLAGLASVELLLGRTDEAQAAISRLLAIAKKALGEQHPLYARGLWLQGQWELSRKRVAQGRSSLQAALEILKKVFPDGHPDIAALEGDLAALESNPADAAAHYDVAINMAVTFCGPQHPRVADLLVGQARSLLAAGKTAEAAEAASRAAAIRKQALSPDHPKLAEALEVQAQVLRGSANPADRQQAVKLEKQAQEIRAKHAENDRPE